VAVVRPESARHLGDTTRALFELGSGQVVLTPDLRAPWTADSIAELHAGLRDAGETWKAFFRRGRAILFEPLHGKILTHLKEGIPCPERCTLAGRSFAVAPSGRLYACGQMIGEDGDDRLAIGTVDAGFDPERVAQLQQRRDRVEKTCAPCSLRERCQSRCGCRHLALTSELGQINQTLCEIEESFILAADEVASTLMAEKCSTFLATYYPRAHRPAEVARLTRMRRPGESAG
jgi:radical SAM protein with 4Fe4S-binding SPASM domain